MAVLLGAIGKGMIIGQKTKYYVDVKSPIKAGMQFGTNNYKMRVVGYEVTRLYYDSKEKDYQVGSQRVKRVIKK
jgi:hypothetical protein